MAGSRGGRVTALGHGVTGRQTPAEPAVRTHGEQALSVPGGRRAGLAVRPEAAAMRVALRGPCTLDGGSVRAGRSQRDTGRVATGRRGYGASSHQAPGAAGGRARPRCVSACGHGLQRRGLRAAEGVEGGGQRREPPRVGGLRRRAEGTACRCPRARLSTTRHRRSVLACPESGAWVVM